MILLAIESSASSVSVAVLSDQKVLGYRWEKMERGQGEALIPLIQSLLAELGLDIQAITAVAVAVGPGSFTGVRVALSAARAVGLALNVPVMGVTNFEVASFELPKPLTVVLDTKRGDYYTQFLDETGAVMGEPVVLDSTALKKTFAVCGCGRWCRKIKRGNRLFGFGTAQSARRLCGANRLGTIEPSLAGRTVLFTGRGC